MPRSKRVVFRQGRLERISRDFDDLSPILRFKIDGEFFFASLLQFQDPDGCLESMDQAEPGQEVYLGAHRLDDGSFWLHWLKVPGRFDLKPLPPNKAVQEAREKVMVWGFFMVMALLAAAVFVFGARSGGAAIFGSLIFCGAVFCGVNAFEGVSVLMNSASSVDKAAHRGRESLEAALAEGRPWQTPGLRPAEASPPPEFPKLPPGLAVCRVDRALVHHRYVHRLTGRSTTIVSFVIYDFMAEKRVGSDLAEPDEDHRPSDRFKNGAPPLRGRDGREMVSWPMVDTAYNLASMPAFRRSHPPFLAPGDEVLILALNPPGGAVEFINKVGLPALNHKPVLELFNLTDRTAYRSATDLKGDLRTLYLMPVIVIPVSLFMCAAIAFFSSIGEGFGLAVMEALKFMGIVAPMGVLTMGVILLLVEAVTALTDNRPLTVSGRENWRMLADSLKRKTAVSGFSANLWERFRPRRIWIVVMAMAVSAGVMTLMDTMG